MYSPIYFSWSFNSTVRPHPTLHTVTQPTSSFLCVRQSCTCTPSLLASRGSPAHGHQNSPNSTALNEAKILSFRSPKTKKSHPAFCRDIGSDFNRATPDEPNTHFTVTDLIHGSAPQTAIYSQPYEWKAVKEPRVVGRRVQRRASDLGPVTAIRGSAVVLRSSRVALEVEVKRMKMRARREDNRA